MVNEPTVADVDFEGMMAPTDSAAEGVYRTMLTLLLNLWYSRGQ